jgi:hypothetical protein
MNFAKVDFRIPNSLNYFDIYSTVIIVIFTA